VLARVSTGTSSRVTGDRHAEFAASEEIARKPPLVPGAALVIVSRICVVVTASKLIVVGSFDAGSASGRPCRRS
jgi:hypothetical protein